MRPDLIVPEDPTHERLTDILALVGVTVRLNDIRRWTELEVALAFDWANREYFKASDNNIRTRSKPSFVAFAEELATMSGVLAEMARSGQVVIMDPKGSAWQPRLDDTMDDIPPVEPS